MFHSLSWLWSQKVIFYAWTHSNCVYFWNTPQEKESLGTSLYILVWLLTPKSGLNLIVERPILKKRLIWWEEKPVCNMEFDWSKHPWKSWKDPWNILELSWHRLIPLSRKQLIVTNTIFFRECTCRTLYRFPDTFFSNALLKLVFLPPTCQANKAK